MKSLEEYIELARVAHGHICAGQILGVRMAMYGVGLLGLEDPAGQDRKKLVTYIEIDRCATDAIGVVTGCRLGKRALKFRDWGKMAATFCDLSTDRAVRVVALETSREKAREYFPDIENRNEQQMQAYRSLPESDLFSHRWVKVRIGPEEMPGYKGQRITCQECGEGISFQREVVVDGQTLCKACAGERYWEPAAP